MYSKTASGRLVMQALSPVIFLRLLLPLDSPIGMSEAEMASVEIELVLIAIGYNKSDAMAAEKVHVV